MWPLATGPGRAVPTVTPWHPERWTDISARVFLAEVVVEPTAWDSRSGQWTWMPYGMCTPWTLSYVRQHLSAFPTGTRRNNNVFITSKRRRRRRFDVMKTISLRLASLLRYVSVGLDHMIKQRGTFVIRPIFTETYQMIQHLIQAYVITCTQNNPTERPIKAMLISVKPPLTLWYG